MSLFGDLPAPSNKRDREDSDPDEANRVKQVVDTSAPQPAKQTHVQVDLHDVDDLNDDDDDDDSGSEPDTQQQQPTLAASIPREQTNEPNEQPQQPAATTQLQPTEATKQQQPPPSSSDAAAEADQVSLALLRITGHIRNPKKFSKAAELLTKLFHQQNTLNPQQHGTLVFAALQAAMIDPNTSHDALLVREYSRLFTLASKHTDLFNTAQRSQLDVYGIWAVFRNKMLTDDSFAFNKVLVQLKEMISQLPIVVDDDEGGDEGDGVWSEGMCMNKRREALLDCIATGQQCYKNAWARTSVDLLIEHAKQHSNKFTAAQQPRLEAFTAFVRDQKAIRKQGPSAKETARDTTSFERARAAWGDASWISKRGKVGGGGDSQSHQWLG